MTSRMHMDTILSNWQINEALLLGNSHQQENGESINDILYSHIQTLL